MLENVSQDINKKVTFIWDQAYFMSFSLKILHWKWKIELESDWYLWKSRHEAWTAWLLWHMMMAFFSWLWDKETGKDNHLNSMQESWGKWRIVSKDFFTLFFFWHNGTPEFDDEQPSFFFKTYFSGYFAKLICMLYFAAAVGCCFKTSFEFLSKCYHVLWVPKQSPWEIVRGEIWINSHLHANSTF